MVLYNTVSAVSSRVKLDDSGATLPLKPSTRDVKERYLTFRVAEGSLSGLTPRVGMPA